MSDLEQNRPSHFALERYLLSELSEAETHALEARLRADPELMRELEVIRHDLPNLRSLPSRQFPISRWSWSRSAVAVAVAAAASVAMVAGLLVFHTPSEPLVQIKGSGISVVAVRQREDRVMRGASSFRAGDHLQFELSCQPPRTVVVDIRVRQTIGTRFPVDRLPPLRCENAHPLPVSIRIEADDRDVCLFADEGLDSREGIQAAKPAFCVDIEKPGRE